MKTPVLIVDEKFDQRECVVLGTKHGSVDQLLQVGRLLPPQLEILAQHHWAREEHAADELERPAAARQDDAEECHGGRAEQAMGSGELVNESPSLIFSRGTFYEARN